MIHWSKGEASFTLEAAEALLSESVCSRQPLKLECLIWFQAHQCD